MNISILNVLLSLLPTVFVLAVASIWAWRCTRGSRVPVKDKLLRAPGETLRSQIEKLDEELPGNIAVVCFYGPLCLVLWVVFRQLRARSPHLQVETAAFLWSLW